MIDSHHSFWKYEPDDLPFIEDSMQQLKGDFLLDELEDDLEFSGIDQVISVQCRRSDRENKFLLEKANQSDDLVTGVVAWAPLASRDLQVFLDQYSYEPLIKGYRETIETYQPKQFFDNLDFDEGMRALTKRGLTFDLSVTAEQLPATIQFIDKHPNQAFTLNHCGRPLLHPTEFPSSWARNIRELARRPHVFCKLSGLTSTESLPSYQIRPYFDTLLHAFTPQRLMYASDWPMCKQHTSYPAWLNTIDDLIHQLSPDEKYAIHQGAAIQFYKL